MDKALLNAANLYAEAAKIIANALQEMAHPTLKREDIEGNATAILARLAHSNILLERYDTNRITETINWIDASVRLPDAGSEVLVCYERNDCEERDSTIAEFDDSDDEDGPWTVDGGLMCFGAVMFWAEMPTGPSRK